MQRAVLEFRRQTGALGMRVDSAHAQRSAPRPAWHGRLFENFRNDALDAIPHEIRQRGQQNSLLRRNQFGFNIGGPVLIPHLVSAAANTFFSLSYEGVREHISRTVLQTVPTLAERTGDFSATVDKAGQPLLIYDPETTRPNPDFDSSRPVSTANLQYLRDPFPGNRIPMSRLDPTAQAAMALYPAPNTNVGPFFQNNFFINSPETNIANGVIAKVDTPVKDSHRLSAEVDYSNGLLGAPRWFPTDANPGPADRNFQNRMGSLQDVWTISPRTINTATLQVRSNVSKAGAGQAIFPRYVIAPYLGLGRAFPFSSVANNIYDWSDGISSRRGKHALRLSGRYTANQVNTFLPQFPEGLFRFSSGLTSLPGINDTGHGFASFMLGLSQYAERSVVADPSYFRRSSGTLGMADQYQAAKSLSIRFALATAVRTPRVEKYNRQSNIDLTRINPANGRPGALVAAGRDGVSRGFRPTTVSFQPSVSLAWNPLNRSDTVVRAAYSRANYSIPIYANQWGTQAFHARQTFISPNVQLAPALVLRQGIPPLGYALPNLSPEAANDSVADLLDMSGRLPMIQSASLSLERQLPKSIVVALDLGHSRGRDLLLSNGAANPNAIPAAALQYRDQLNDENFNASLRPYPQYKSFDLNSSYPLGQYQRDALSIRVEKRASGGLSVNAVYTFSKQMDDYSAPYGEQDFYNRRNDWALSAYSRPQELQLNYVYELPLGANKAFLPYADWRRFLVEGWSVSGNVYVAAGTPLALHPEFNNTGGVLSTLNVDVVPGVPQHVKDQGPALWFNPAAFDQPPDFTVGDASPTLPNLSNPGVHSFDLSVSKRFPLSADRTFEFNASAFDFINHADWNQPDTVIGPASAPNLNAGKIIGSHGGRVIQLGARLSF
ncbi:MAG TPA: hypothetical protein DEQ47_13150 [Solibacterales bacterium]|nr:hypothetical protein [Bryobacterales bacterium]